MARSILRTLLFSTMLLLSAASLSADDVSGDPWRISILASEISESDADAFSESGDTRAGIGVGVAYSPKPNWDVELTVATKNYRTPYAILFSTRGPGNSPQVFYRSFQYRDFRVQPVDLSVTRVFLADELIAPYFRAGVRYVDAPSDPTSEATVVTGPGIDPSLEVTQMEEGFGYEDRTSGQASAGVRIRLTPRASLRTEVTRLLRSDGATFDPLMRFAAGVSWAF